MDELRKQYIDFKELCKSKYTPDNYRKYKKDRENIFSMLKVEYQRSGEKVKPIENIINALIEEATDPLGFWGSEKIADRNHYVYIADKEGRLFEELRNWYERKIGYDKSGKACIA